MLLRRVAMASHEPVALRREAFISFLVCAVAVAVLALAPHVHVEPAQIAALRESLQVWSVIPFALMLAAIAVLPIVAAHWWENNWRRALVAAVLSAPVIVFLLWGHGAAGAFELQEKAVEYVSFIVLLGALYVISGGIYVPGSLDGTPALNTVLLALGAVLASFIGTTGASMVLIRPLLRANEPRQRKVHVVIFFIFIVSNCGGLLTPLGDPPLFLGFLKGVPFDWTLVELWPVWLATNVLLLALFFLVDKVIFDREEEERPGSQLDEVKHHERLGIRGGFNFILLAAVVGVVYANGRGVLNEGTVWSFGVQEGLLLVLAAGSFILTRAEVHQGNVFVFDPIIEVAVLFAGIFVTMAPALVLLNAHAPEFGMDKPWQFFWATGLLSSFLDNAPTYLAMSATAAGLLQIPVEGRFLVRVLASTEGEALLRAVSVGAVLMGANTYIGNGPNFMVKAVAEHRGVRMPSFFGYTAWSGAVLIPVFVLVTFLFFRS